MPGHSRSKNGVASLAYVPGIPIDGARPIGMAGTSPAMTQNGRGHTNKQFRRAYAGCIAGLG